MSWGARLLDALDSEGRVKAEHRRRVALELAAYATNDGKGRDVGDPVHEAITEGRTLANMQRRARGSPCLFQDSESLVYLSKELGVDPVWYPAEGRWHPASMPEAF